MPAVIRCQDLVQSVADALQFISYYHPADYIRALGRAYEREQSPAAKDAIAQILTNSRLCAEGHRPICQDTGIVNVFLKVGMDVRFEGFAGALADAVNEGVRRAYNHPDNKLRASVLEDPQFARRNTKDNTPAVVNVELVPGDKVAVDVAAKGGGSEAKAKFAMLNPSDSVVEWVLKTVPTMGAGWCPPGMLGIGIGGTAEKAMVMAKEALMEPIDMAELKARGPKDQYEELRIELYDKVNALGIGAQGLGGLSTVLDVKIASYPTHAANKPIAMIPNCAATRHAHFVLDGSGPAEFEAPSIDDWPKVTWSPSKDARRVDLDRRRHQRHLAATSSICSHSRRARSTAASKECNLTPKASAASWCRGSRSLSSDSMSGVMKPGSSAATAAATTDATGVRLKPSRIAGRRTSITSAIRSISCW